ncbi:MAG TPA: FAD-dependent oxidoreductase [Nocardioides sp.]|nr:FAD-dependent oxidoreductase [Nocardioides sp.]
MNEGHNDMDRNSSTHEIVVLGGGYAGMMAAARLARRCRRMPVRITLVNPSEWFTERLRTHQLAAGEALRAHGIADVFAGTAVTFRRAAATSIDPDGRVVTLDDGSTLAYDTLVYALGSRTDTASVPGVADHALTLDAPDRVRERLAELSADGAGTVTVVGAGLTGIEAATEIAESHPALTVTLLGAEEPGTMMGTRARAHLGRALDRLGIERRTGVRVEKVLPGGVDLTSGEHLPSDLTLWTAGVRVSPLAASSGIATDDAGLVLTDATLRSVSHPEIYAVGDAASIRQAWGQVHGTCQSGIPTGAYVGDTIARRLRGRRVRPFRFGYFHQPVSLGRADAVVQFTRADDSPTRWCLTGGAAVRYKESVSGSPLWSFRMSRRFNVPVTISKGGRATRAAATD